MRLQELLSVWLEQPTPIMNGLKEVQRRLFTKIVKRLGWEFPEGEDPSTVNLRAVAIRFAGRAGDPEYVLWNDIFCYLKPPLLRTYWFIGAILIS